MQIDMHYYGTYAMARAAGMNPGAAKTVATCAQLVDDSVSDSDYDLPDGGMICPVVTAHHSDSVKNLDEENQRHIWIPFHFLPGGGLPGDSLCSKLVCQKDSAVAQDMLDHVLEMARESTESGIPKSRSKFSLELLGVASHIYEDTFSHWGFTGVSCPGNRVDADSVEVTADNADVKTDEESKLASFLNDCKDLAIDKCKAVFFDSVENAQDLMTEGSLGHGGVGTCPDEPFLRWSFRYEGKTEAEPKRDNRTHFMDACQQIFQLYQRYVDLHPEAGDGTAPGSFENLRLVVDDVLKTEGNKDTRIAAWQTAAASNDLYTPVEGAIPDYEGKRWVADMEILHGRIQKKFISQPDAHLPGMPVYRFFQAAAHMHHYILRELLPEHDIYVI